MPPAKKQKAANNPVEPSLILCYGDSNSFGQSPSSAGRLPYSSRWTTALQKLLGEGSIVVAEGLNGRTTVLDDPAGSEAMLSGEGMNGRRYLLPCLHSHKPIAVVVLALGCNDLKSKHYFGPHNIVSGVRTLVADVRKSGTGPDAAEPHVVVLSPPILKETAVNAVWGFEDCDRRSRATIDALASACKEDGLDFVDLSAVGGAEVGADGIHLDEGAAGPISVAVAQRIQEALAP